MTITSGATASSPAPVEDRRRHRRIAVALLGRYRLATLQEYPCLSVDVSLGGIAVLAPVKGPVGDRVVLHLEQIGTLEGRVVRHTMTGFAAELRLGPRQRERLKAQLDWLENRHNLGLPERRRHRRVVPLRTAVRVRFEDGRSVATRLLDVSRSGAALLLDEPPPVGAGLVLGVTPGRVVRHFDGGVGVEFLDLLPRDRFSEDLVL
ncbi:MAG TPA: PilZ domain-containing protein [Microvirga sp.]|jgi:hypothetical protein|nr:PilZ domain-containing protein [Microvirga sp.]